MCPRESTTKKTHQQRRSPHLATCTAPCCCRLPAAAGSLPQPQRRCDQRPSLTHLRHEAGGQAGGRACGRAGGWAGRQLGKAGRHMPTEQSLLQGRKPRMFGTGQHATTAPPLPSPPSARPATPLRRKQLLAQLLGASRGVAHCQACRLPKAGKSRHPVGCCALQCALLSWCAKLAASAGRLTSGSRTWPAAAPCVAPGSRPGAGGRQARSAAPACARCSPQM